MTATLVYAAAEAAYTIVRGGSEVTAGSGIAYSVLITAASVAVWRWLQRQAGSSELLVAESSAWRIAALRGVGMVAGFTVLLVITGSALDRLAPYVDPVMVLVTCVAFLPPPLRMLRSTLLELLERVPPPHVVGPVHEALDRVTADFELRDVTVRMTKLGPKLYLEVEALARPEVTIGEMDGLRQDIERSLAHLPYEVWLNVDLRPASPRG